MGGGSVRSSLRGPARVYVLCVCTRGAGRRCPRSVSKDIRVVEDVGVGVEEVFLSVSVRALGVSVPGHPAVPMPLQDVK